MVYNLIIDKRSSHNRGFTSGGALFRGTLRRNLEVYLPFEPLQNPDRTSSPRPLCAIAVAAVRNFSGLT